VTRRHRQDGFTAAEFAAGVGLLIFPIAVLVLSLPVWAQTQEAGRLAAQQAARAIVVADDHAAGLARADALAGEVLDNLGVERVGGLDVDGELRPVAAGQPQQLVTVTVTVRMPAVSLPLIGAWATFDHRVSHSQPVDRYRGFPG
jgi:hypothetical protein